MTETKNHKLPLLPLTEQITPTLSLITDSYLAIGELNGQLISDLINPSLIKVAESKHKKVVINKAFGYYVPPKLRGGSSI